VRPLRFLCLLVGGLVFEGTQKNVQNLPQEGYSFGRIILLNTSFVNNSATQLGSAILSTNVEDVLVSCQFDGGTQKKFLQQDDVIVLARLDPKKLCDSWNGNHLATSGMSGVVGTFGKRLSFSMNSSNSSRGVRLVTNKSEKFVLENVQSGERLPEIEVVVIDAFGNRAAPTRPHSISIVIISPDEFFQGALTVNTTMGRSSFSNIVGFKSPGYYKIKIIPQISTIAESIVNVSVRNCYVGEEPTIENDLCQACDDFSYNFNVSKPGGCTPCPEGAMCKGRYIAPQDGYWHKGPCHNEITECITETACKYKTRHEHLSNFTENGLSGNLECLKCEFVFFSLLRLFGIILYLLLATTLTIKGTLSIASRRLVRQDAMILLHEDVRCTPKEEGTPFQIEETTQVGNNGSYSMTSEEQVICQNMHSPLAHGIEMAQRHLIETWKVCFCASSSANSFL